MALSGKRKAVRAIDNAVDAIVGIVLVILLLIGAYSIWDNQQIEHAAAASQWKTFKPDIPETYNFDLLKQENPDVIGWLEIYGTSIDYPLLYSDNNDKYLTLDAKGAYSLAGSIFLDSKCDPHFNDLETIIYGHHMENDLMFGPLDHFSDEAFFSEHRYGKLTYDNLEYGLDIFAFLRADAYDDTIYRRGITDPVVEEEFVSHLRAYALNDSGLAVSGNDKIVLLSTCAAETTAGRTIVIAKMTDDVPENTFTEWPNPGTGIGDSLKLFGLDWYIWIPIFLLPLLLLVLLLIWAMNRANQHKGRRDDGETPELSIHGERRER